MANTGSGQGSPLPVLEVSESPYDVYEELDYIPNCAVSLARYAKLVRYDEPSFWGVVYENQPRYGCGPLWTEKDRFQIQMALAIAQQQIESFINYPLCPTWVSGTLSGQQNQNHRWVDQQNFRARLLTRYPRLIKPGRRAVATVDAGALLDHGPKIATVGPITVSFTDPNEVRVFYPGGNRLITPSKVTISGTSLTIEIPRYRLVKDDLLDDSAGGLLYEEMDNFLSSVDVVRVYNDPTVQAELVSPGCSNGCVYGCEDCTQSACMYIRDHVVGVVDIRPANYDSDSATWRPETVCARYYSMARLNYMCGMQSLDLEAENAIVRLAHSLMTVPPCACDYIQEMWKRDSEMPKVLTREILNCPFGKTEGAWTAYTWAKRFRSVRAENL